MFGPKCWDVVTGEFVGDCQRLDKLIKGLLADGFAEERSSGWHSPAAKTHDYIHTASQRLLSLTVPLFLGYFDILVIELVREERTPAHCPFTCKKLYYRADVFTSSMSGINLLDFFMPTISWDFL